jgi:hypothetical protein
MVKASIIITTITIIIITTIITMMAATTKSTSNRERRAFARRPLRRRLDWSRTMTLHNHSVVWIDHHEARVFHFSAEDVEKLTVQPNDPHVHIHQKTNMAGSGHASEDQDFFHEVVEAIGASKAILITGPGLAKTALVKHIARHDPTLLEQIAAVETVDHPSDGALLAHARAYFKTADLMTPQN